MKRILANIKILLTNIAELFIDVGKMLIQSTGLIYDVLGNNVLTSIISLALDKSINISKSETTIKIEEASSHLNEAGIILDGLQKELGSKKEELDNLIKYIDEKEHDAKHWESLVEVNKDLANAITTEIRDNLRVELDKNKTRKRILSFISWLITLILGGVVGALISKYYIN